MGCMAEKNMKPSTVMARGRVVRPLIALLAVCSLATGLSGCGTSSPSAQNRQQTSSSTTTKKKTAKKPVTKAPSLKKKQGTKKAEPEKSTSESVTGTTADTTKERSVMCGTDELEAQLTAGAGAGAGSSYPYLVLTNKGSRTCLERGYPGVSLQAGGRQIGAAANRDTSVAPVSIWLKPGESAHSELQIVNADAYDGPSCSARQAQTLVVFPPDQTQSLSIPATGYKGCENVKTAVIRVRPLQPGK
jgi:hypothetical protein